MAKIIGIDPGRFGGIAVANERGVHTLELLENIDPVWLAAQAKDDDTHVYLEKAQVMPKNGAVGMFHYGLGQGRIIGWLEAIKIPFTLIAPGIWTRAMHVGCSGATAKEKSLLAASRLFPNLDFKATERSKKMHPGLIDAALICEFGRRKQVGAA